MFPKLSVLFFLGLMWFHSLWVISSSADMGTHHHPASPRSIEKIEYSEWNHQKAGMIIVMLGFIGLLMEVSSKLFPQFRSIHWLWPGAWIVFGVFLFIRNDPDNWPWGHIGFVETMLDPETGQHKLFNIFVVAIGMVEGWRIKNPERRPWTKLVFPGLVFVSAIILALHSQIHVATTAVYWHHMSLAGLGVVIATGKYARDRGALGGWAGALLWPTFLILAGLQLQFYDER